jgi:photosystem II stability/assembly factor-like uncharacterized protein
MKYLILITIFFTSNLLLSQWEAKNTPSGVFSINNIYSNDNYYLFSNGTLFYESIDRGVNWDRIYPIGLDSIGMMSSFYGYKDTFFICSFGLKDKYLGGLYKSTDRGKNWNNIFLNSKVIGSYSFSISNNNYYLLNGYGLLKSTDFGVNWDTINTVDYKLSYMNHLESSGDTILLSDIGLNDFTKPLKVSNYGIYFSFDGGNTFELRVNGIGLDKTFNNVVKLYNDVCFIGTDKGLFKSTDFGLNWEKTNLDKIYQEVIKIERDNNYIYVGTKIGEIYKSNDFGETWDKVYQSKTSNPILVLKNINEEIFFSLSGLSTGIYKLTENSFENFIIPIPSSNYQTIYNDNKLYLLTHLTSIYSSNDFAESWIPINDSLYINRFQKDRFFVENNIILAYYSLENKISISNDYGKTWIDKSFPEQYISAFLINGRILVTTSADDRFYSDDGGISWININEKHGENPEGRFYINKILNDKDDLLAVTTFNGIIKSTNKGITWFKLLEKDYPPYYFEGLNNFAFNGKTIIATKIDRQEGKGNTILYSDDFGKTWEEIKFSDSLVHFNEIINYKDNFFIASSLGFHYSTDNGKTWYIYNDGLPDYNSQKGIAFVRDIDLINDNLLIIGQGTLFSLPLSNLDINYTGVEKVENRSYLYTLPPYPHPTNKELKIHTYYWDNNIQLTNDNIEVYNINSEKINIINNLNIVKTGINEANIIWDVSNQNPGTYFVKIKYGSETRFQKVLIIK